MAEPANGSPIPQAEPDDDLIPTVDGLADALRDLKDPRDERRLIFAKAENYRHIRHAQVLERWQVLPEPWARRVEHLRISSVDRTPGAATFGR